MAQCLRIVRVVSNDTLNFKIETFLNLNVIASKIFAVKDKASLVIMWKIIPTVEFDKIINFYIHVGNG